MRKEIKIFNRKNPLQINAKDFLTTQVFKSFLNSNYYEFNKLIEEGDIPIPLLVTIKLTLKHSISISIFKECIKTFKGRYSDNDMTSFLHIYNIEDLKKLLSNEFDKHRKDNSFNF